MGRYPPFALYAASCAASCSGGYSGGGFHDSLATGFVTSPRPSTSWKTSTYRVTSAISHGGGCHTGNQVGSSARHHRQSEPLARRCSVLSSVRSWSMAGMMPAAGMMLSRSGTSSFLVAESATALSAATRGPSTGPTSTEQMDSEWAAILADDDDEEEDEDKDEDKDVDFYFPWVEGDDKNERESIDGMSGVDMIAADASQGGDLEGLNAGGGDADAEEGKPRRARYKSYKERVKAEKAREESLQDTFKKLPKHHIEYLEQAQRNRDMAAARREKYTKKFFRQKKLHDIIKDRGQRAVREATRATRWPRKIKRSLEELEVGEWLEGKVRNVESYGAWVDVNAERDGLLHVRDMSQIFTPSAEHMVATRDSLRVRVKFVDPGAGKLGLSLVEERSHEDDLPNAPPRPKISVADVAPGAELWGYVERVTNLGAYVNVGAERPGFLLLKEIPGRPKGLDAPNVLRKNKRLRVYAKEVDPERLRIKLTCKRPRSRPRCGPAPALASDAFSEEFEYDDTRGRKGDGEEEGQEDLGLEREEWWNDDDNEDDEDEDEGDWFFPERGEVIPPSPEGSA